MDQGLVGRLGEECADDVHVDNIREGVASLGEPTDVIPQGLAGLLLAALEVPGVTRADIRPLEISDKDPLEVHPVTDAVVREEFKFCFLWVGRSLGQHNKPFHLWWCLVGGRSILAPPTNFSIVIFIPAS